MDINQGVKGLEFSLLIGITAGISMVLLVMIAITYLLIRQGRMAKELVISAAARKMPRKRSTKGQGGKDIGAPSEGADDSYLAPNQFQTRKSLPNGKAPNTPDSPTHSEHIYEDPDYDMEKNAKMPHHYENAKPHTYVNSSKPGYGMKGKMERRSTDSSEDAYARSSSDASYA